MDAQQRCHQSIHVSGVLNWLVAESGWGESETTVVVVGGGGGGAGVWVPVPAAAAGGGTRAITSVF